MNTTLFFDMAHNTSNNFALKTKSKFKNTHELIVTFLPQPKHKISVKYIRN